MRYLKLLSIIILIPTLYAAGITDDKTGTITGSVSNAITGEPLPGVAVMVVGSRLGGSTDIEGSYEIPNVPAGKYTLRAILIGFEPNAKNDIVVEHIRPSKVNFRLQESAIVGEDVIITPDYFAKTPDSKISTQVQSSEEIRRLPGGFEDVVRAVSILPGVAQAQAGRNDLIIRGGAPSENLFIVENLEVNNINHFGTQGSGGGPLSYINLDYVDQTAFSTGGFGARYGDKLSSVLNIELRDGRTDRLGGKGTISASQFGFDLEGPVTGNGSFLLSARRSYLDIIFKAAGFSFVPEYWDFLAKTDYQLNRNNHLSILAIGAIDNTRFFNDDRDDRYDNSTVLGSDQTQAITGATWRHLLGKGYFNLTLGTNYVDFNYEQRDSLLSPLLSNKSNERESYMKLELTYQLTKSLEFTTGFTGKNIGFTNDIYLPEQITDFGDTVEISGTYESYTTKGASFAQVSYNNPYFRTTLGGRLDYFDLIEDKFAFSPRLANTIKISEKTNLNFSMGRYYQSPSYIWLTANPVNRELSFIGVDQYVVGIDRLIRPDTKISIEVYYKRYFDYPASLTRQYLVMANTGAGFGGSNSGFASFGFDPLVSEGEGAARGIEMLLQKKLSEIPVYGLLSLSYSHADFTALDGVKRPSSFDQHWILNIGGGYIPNANWEFAAKFRLATGKPYTLLNPDGTRDETNYNSERLSASHILDIRIDKRWMFSNWMLVTYLDIQNVYDNPTESIPEWDERTQSIDDDESIGLLPSIGVSIVF